MKAVSARLKECDREPSDHVNTAGNQRWQVTGQAEQPHRSGKITRLPEKGERERDYKVLKTAMTAVSVLQSYRSEDK